jgi:hypothetical protein
MEGVGEAEAGEQGERFRWGDPSTWSNPHQYVQSSNLESVAYDDRHELLQIIFRNDGRNSGRVYNYVSVPPSVYFGLMNAPSKGIYHWQHIRCSYSYSDLSGKSNLRGCDAQGGIRGSGPVHGPIVPGMPPRLAPKGPRRKRRY